MLSENEIILMGDEAWVSQVDLGITTFHLGGGWPSENFQSWQWQTCYQRQFTALLIDSVCSSPDNRGRRVILGWKLACSSQPWVHFGITGEQTYRTWAPHLEILMSRSGSGTEALGFLSSPGNEEWSPTVTRDNLIVTEHVSINSGVHFSPLRNHPHKAVYIIPVLQIRTLRFE